MVVMGFKSLEKMIESRLKSNENVIAIVNPQAIVVDGDRNYFYTTTGVEIRKDDFDGDDISLYIELIVSDSYRLLVDLKNDINENKVILVENRNKPKLIKADDISSVQIVVS